MNAGLHAPAQSISSMAADPRPCPATSSTSWTRAARPRASRSSRAVALADSPPLPHATNSRTNPVSIESWSASRTAEARRRTRRGIRPCQSNTARRTRDDPAQPTRMFVRAHASGTANGFSTTIVASGGAWRASPLPRAQQNSGDRLLTRLTNAGSKSISSPWTSTTLSSSDRIRWSGRASSGSNRSQAVRSSRPPSRSTRATFESTMNAVWAATTVNGESRIERSEGWVSGRPLGIGRRTRALNMESRCGEWRSRHEGTDTMAALRRPKDQQSAAAGAAVLQCNDATSN